MSLVSLSIVIPTYNRGATLLHTVNQLLEQRLLATEVILVDQTDYQKTDDVFQKLSDLHSSRQIKWVRKKEPSIPKAMNRGLLEAKAEWVLFLDDDINVSRDFVAAHVDIINAKQALAHVGQVIQPWQQPNLQISGYYAGANMLRDLNFPFNSSEPARIHNCMAGNLCVNRRAAMQVGGFDENFSGPAYRFETEFCRRFIRYHGESFLYAPSASLHHLHLSSGGTRAHGDHLTSASSAHSMGDYYFALLNDDAWGAARYILKRFFTSVMAKFYLRHPVYIPSRLCGEIAGLYAAIKACRRGPSLINIAPESQGQKADKVDRVKSDA